jgi:hypothetical protein
MLYNQIYSQYCFYWYRIVYKWWTNVEFNFEQKGNQQKYVIFTFRKDLNLINMISYTGK